MVSISWSCAMMIPLEVVCPLTSVSPKSCTRAQLLHRTYCLLYPFKLATSDLHSKFLEDTAFVFISSLPQCLAHCYLHNKWWKTTSWVEGRKAISKEADESDESETRGWKEAKVKDIRVQCFSVPQKEWETEDLVLLWFQMVVMHKALLEN